MEKEKQEGWGKLVCDEGGQWRENLGAHIEVLCENIRMSYK